MNPNLKTIGTVKLECSNIDEVTIQNSVYDSGKFPSSRTKKGKKSWRDFKTSLFCVNWQFVSTYENSVRNIYLGKN